MNNINICNYRRVSKKTAFKLFLEGKTITLAGVKMNLANIYGVGVSNISLSRCNDWALDEIGRKNAFNNLVDSFIYYNCNYECGYYPAFYIYE